MKKVITLLLVCAAALTLLVACEKEKPHEHTFDSVWLYDEVQHWHGASCEHDDAETDRGDHVDSDGNDICDICGYIADHTHTFETEWTADENTHYYKATCGHNVKKDEATHPDTDNDGTCDVCGYNGGHEHTYGEVLTPVDETGHWYAPTCGHSVEGLSKEAHVDENNDGGCDVCGYNGGHEHTYAEEWTTTESEHWKAITCGHSVLAELNKGAHKDEDGDSACDVCGYIPEHFHTFEEGWTSDESSHWHRATCGHDTVKNDEAAHDGYEEDGICDTCGYRVFRTYTVTVDAPAYIKVQSPAGIAGNSFTVKENTTVTFTFTLPGTAELTGIRGAEIVGDPADENGTRVYTVQVAGLNADTTVSITAVNYSAVEVIVENGTFSMSVEGAFKFSHADITFDAPEAGKYVIFSTSHPDVSFGIGEMGEDGYAIYSQVYVLDVNAPGTAKVQAQYFSWSVPEGGKMDVSYVITRIDGSLTLTDLISDGYTLPTNVNTTVYFTAPTAGRYQISSSLLGLIWNDYVCNSIILEATEDNQVLSFTVQYANTSAATFAFDCSIWLMEKETVGVGEHRLTAPYGLYTAISIVADRDGSYQIESDNPYFRFYTWNKDWNSMVGLGASHVIEDMKAGESYVLYLSLDTFDYEGNEDITDVVTVSYLGYIPVNENGGYTAAVGIPNTFVNDADASEFCFAVTNGAQISMDGTTWSDTFSVFCEAQDVVTYWVRPASSDSASTVFVSVETITYEFNLSVGTQHQVMVPGKDYTVYLSGSDNPAYYVDYILSWSSDDITVVYNAAPVASGELLQGYSEYYSVVITYNGTEEAEITFTLTDPYEG